MNNYILSYDPLSPSINSTQLSQFIQVHRDISAWYNPFMGTYFIKSEAELVPLSQSFIRMFQGSPFMLSSVFPTLMGGALDPSVWTWINTGVLPAAKPLDPHGLLNSLKRLNDKSQ